MSTQNLESQKVKKVKIKYLKVQKNLLKIYQIMSLTKNALVDVI